MSAHASVQSKNAEDTKNEEDGTCEEDTLKEYTLSIVSDNVLLRMVKACEFPTLYQDYGMIEDYLTFEDEGPRRHLKFYASEKDKEACLAHLYSKYDMDGFAFL